MRRMEPVVSVRGEAVLEVEPEVATVRVTVAARDKERDRAIASLERRADVLSSLLARFGDAVERVETAAVHVSPQFKDNKPNEKIVGYVATMSSTVVVSDFAVLGDMVSELSSQELAEVAGPWWSLRPDSDRYRQARVAAAQDAVGRAREYAEALGGSLQGLVELADSGLLSDMGGPVEPPMVPAAAMRPAGAPRGAAPAAGPPPIDFSPARQVVRARVEGRFTMTAPDLRASIAPPS